MTWFGVGKIDKFYYGWVHVYMYMVEHQSDNTVVEYPDAPGDYGEIFDYVVRKGPISHDAICDNTPFMAPNEIYNALQWCVDHGFMAKTDGDLEEHGTTRTIYYVPVDASPTVKHRSSVDDPLNPGDE